MTSFWPAQRGHVEPGHPLPRGPGARHPARAHGPSPGGQGPGQGGKSPWPEPRNAVGSYGALTPGLQDPGRGLSPGPPDAPARRETVAGERSRGTEERSGPPGRALAGSAFLGHSPQAALSLTWALARNGPGFHSPPPTPAVRVSGPGWLPAARESGLGLKTLPQDLRCWVQRNAPSLLSCRGRRRGAYRRAPASSASTPGLPGRPPLWEELVGCLCRGPWPARDLMGAGAVDAGQRGWEQASRLKAPLRTRPLLPPLLDGCGNLLPGSLPLLFRVVRSRLPLLPSGLRSHVGTAFCG